MRLVVLALTLVGGLIPAVQAEAACPFRPPVDASILRGFLPVGRFAGHWGVDYDTAAGTAVRAASGGVVTFSGVVAANVTVTVDHGGGVKTSYSFLAERLVRRGDRVEIGQVVGRTGPGADSDHGGLHFSVRLGGRYLDPLAALGCATGIPLGALRLIS